MTNLSILPEDEPFEEWLEKTPIVDLIGEATDLAEFTPYVKAVLGAVSWFRRKRAKAFLRSLKDAADGLPPDKREALDKVMRSKAGAAILSEYAESVIRTSSETAIAAMALLYSDSENEIYSPQFKLAAAISLRGISEREVDVFLALSGVKEFITAKNQPELPYPVAIANDGLVTNFPGLADVLGPAESRVAIVHDLIGRGLLLPDFASSRYGDGGVGVTFGIGAWSHTYRELLTRARSVIPNGESSSA
jgi:hypothetical protein